MGTALQCGEHSEVDLVFKVVHNVLPLLVGFSYSLAEEHDARPMRTECKVMCILAEGKLISCTGSVKKNILTSKINTY